MDVPCMYREGRPAGLAWRMRLFVLVISWVGKGGLYWRVMGGEWDKRLSRLGARARAGAGARSIVTKRFAAFEACPA